MESETTNADPPSLLPGTTASFWMRRQTFGLMSAIVFALIMAFGSFLDTPIRQLFVVVAVAGVAACSAFGLYASARALSVICRETAAGYTTLHNRYPSLWQLDPGTGTVVRRPTVGPSDHPQD